MSLLLLFNQPGGTGPPPPPPTTVLPINIGDVYVSPVRMRGAYLSAMTIGATYSPSTPVKGVQNTVP